MASRSKRAKSSARPGTIVLAAKQKRRTTAEKAADDRSKELAKAAQEQADIDANDVTDSLQAHGASVERVAAKELEIRAEDNLARQNFARPDLATAVMKRKKDAEVAMDTDSEHENQDLDALDGASDDDDSFQPVDEESDGDASMDASEDEAAYQEVLVLKKKATKMSRKVAKSAIRSEINEAAGVSVNDNSLKRKPSGPSTEVEAKKSKMVVGGPKKGWEKSLKALNKPSKTPVARGRTDSISAPRGRTGSISSTASMPPLRSVSRSTMGSARSSVVSLPIGEFDKEESQETLAAAREIADATAKMCISLVPKDIQLNVDGKFQRQRKPKYTNADLLLPADSFAADLKFWQATVLPELVDWVATNNDPFAVKLTRIFTQPAYTITDVVYAQVSILDQESTSESKIHMNRRESTNLLRSRFVDSRWIRIQL
ncbi:hypothetical protein C8R45DRAFT_944433 [Mycena sanguinolenta]|nr:hypothetical protein C8R45DRAFT_944433 [Mycena sanguinolenta]